MTNASSKMAPSVVQPAGILQVSGQPGASGQQVGGQQVGASDLLTCERTLV